LTIDYVARLTDLRLMIGSDNRQRHITACATEDLKLGASRGQIALWTGSDTEAYFSNLTIR
jgi:hypothetical protein